MEPKHKITTKRTKRYGCVTVSVIPEMGSLLITGRTVAHHCVNSRSI